MLAISLQNVGAGTATHIGADSVGAMGTFAPVTVVVVVVVVVVFRLGLIGYVRYDCPVCDCPD